MRICVRCLRNIQKIPRLSKDRIIKAKRILYGIETLFDNNVLKVSEIFDKKVLNVNTNQDIFSKNFIKNVEKKSFLEDSAIKDFLSKKI